MKLNILFFIALFVSFPIFAQNISIHPVELSIKRPDISRQYEETELVISFRNIGQDFLKVKSFTFTLSDDQGTNLLEKSSENLKAYERSGFFTSRSSNWEYFNYAFYNKPDAFGGKLITYSTPSPQAKLILLKGEVQVWVKGKSGKQNETELKNIVIKPDHEYQIAGGAVKFIENGTLTLDKSQFKNYKVVSDMPISSVAVVGQKKFQGIPTGLDEIFIPADQNEVNLFFTMPDTQILRIPVDLAIGIGF